MSYRYAARGHFWLLVAAIIQACAELWFNRSTCTLIFLCREPSWTHPFFGHPVVYLWPRLLPFFVHACTCFICHTPVLLPVPLPVCVCLCWQHGLPFVWCCCSSSWLFYCLPVILLLDSPWPLLLCSRKKSLLLSVTQSFSTFLSRTSSGFSHISSNREGPEWALCRLGLCNRGEV